MITLNEPEAAILREMARRVMAGRSYKEVAFWANAHGYRTTTGKIFYPSLPCRVNNASGQRALIRAHLAEGNTAEARRAFARFAWLLDRELGLLPSDELAILAGVSFARSA